MLTKPYIEQLLTYYDLGELQHTSPAHQGNVNETALIQTSRGRYVVRHNRQYWSEEIHRYRHQLMYWLYEHEFPIPRLIPMRDGTTLLKHNGRLFEIQQFMAGSDYNPEYPEQLVSIGETLARYHQTIRGYPAPPDETEARYSASRIMGLTERLMECDVMGDLWSTLSWYDTQAARLRKVLPESAYVQLPHCVIHGDMHSDNLRFMGDEVVALLDYDQVAWDSRLVDLADALVSFASTHTYAEHLHGGVFAGPLNEERAALLLEGYMAISPLLPAEVAALPVLVELIWLQGELGWVAAAMERPVEDQLEVLAQGRRLSQWMQEHSTELTAAWTRLNTIAQHRHDIVMAA